MKNTDHQDAPVKRRHYEHPEIAWGMLGHVRSLFRATKQLIFKPESSELHESRHRLHRFYGRWQGRLRDHRDEEKRFMGGLWHQ